MSEVDVQMDLTVSKFSTLIGSEHDLLNVTQLETAGYVQLPYLGRFLQLINLGVVKIHERTKRKLSVYPLLPPQSVCKNVDRAKRVHQVNTSAHAFLL